MSDSAETAAIDVVNQVLAELSEFAGEAQASGDQSLLQARLEQWKRRTTQSISESVSPSIARRFAEIRTRPNWATMEEYPAVMDRHQAFLIALLEDLERHPEAIIQKKDMVIQEKSSPAGKPGVTAPRPEATLPDKVTLAWLFHHVPVKFWWTLMAILFGAFLIGFRLGQSPDVVRILNSLIHR